MAGWEWGGYPAYVSVAERKKNADKEIAALRKKGRDVSPVVLEGRTIAKTFWGKAWCDNLESYSDYANRLPRGRSYVRSGAVVDLQIEEGKARALVRGSSLYTVQIVVAKVPEDRWKRIVGACSGKIDSVMDLLRGKLSSGVMAVIAQRDTGLFPAPKHIRISCSCPDSATLCKHVAAVFFGIGARLDAQPELLFRLCGVAPEELVSAAATGAIAGKQQVAKDRVLGGDLASMFGIDLDAGPAPRATKTSVAKPAAAKPAAAKPAAAKPSPAPTAAATNTSTPKVAARKASPPKAAPPASVAAPTPKPAARRKPTTPAKAPPPPAIITGAELSDMGVPGPTVQSWLKTGVLARTEARGVYARTALTAERLQRHEERRARA